MTYRIDIAKTTQLHQRLSDIARGDRDKVQRALRLANDEMHRQADEARFPRRLDVAATALLLRNGDCGHLRTFAETTHDLVERVLDHVISHPDLLDKHFHDHARIFPWLAKTRGVDHWQVVSRYDVAVTPDGSLKLMELNTGCPGGLLIAEEVSDVTRHGLEILNGDVALTLDAPATVTRHTLVDELLRIEKQAGVEPGYVGILNDENELVFELTRLKTFLKQRGRDAVITNAADLDFSQGRLITEGDKPLSLIYNKFRVSTPRSRNHCWRDGFEQRYAAYLEAQHQQAVVAVNNLGGMTIAEDKALLGLLFHPDFAELFDQRDRRFIDEHVLWTARLTEGKVRLDGQTIDLLPYVREHREQFVIKPANEGRGFGVCIGPDVTDDEWAAACEIDPDMPAIVQRFTPSASFPVVSEPDFLPVPMFLTLGLTVINGRYHGLVSRVSADSVTNVAKAGFGQAVFCDGD